MLVPQLHQENRPLCWALPAPFITFLSFQVKFIFVRKIRISKIYKKASLGFTFSGEGVLKFCGWHLSKTWWCFFVKKSCWGLICVRTSISAVVSYTDLLRRPHADLTSEFLWRMLWMRVCAGLPFWRHYLRFSKNHASCSISAELPQRTPWHQRWQISGISHRTKIHSIVEFSETSRIFSKIPGYPSKNRSKPRSGFRNFNFFYLIHEIII